MRVLKGLLKVLLGVTLGLGLAELAFRARDHGAFPHLNFYVPDEKLGVRLEANASMQLQVAGTNPVTTAATNAEGYRAPAWPPPAPGEVLVVGDSQVFGLGVEANETFSAKLAPLLGRPVLNAGVPTYGPREYTAVVEEVLARRKVGTVIYVLNLANDLFEVERPNLQRHQVWDGWAVRTETAPREEVAEFPFRRALMTRSHLVFALRQWLHSSAPASEGFATEGTWKDVVQAGTGVTPPPPADEQERARLEARLALDKQLEEVARDLEDHLDARGSRDVSYLDRLKPLVPRGGDPRDIVAVRFAEGARRVDLTAHQLFMAAVGETKNEKLLEEVASQRKDPELKKLLAARRELRAKLDALKPEGEAPHIQPLDVVLQKTKAACDRAGARLVVVALPLDVMVSQDEWKKYGVAPLDMTPTRVLTEDVVARAERLGAVGVDPTSALAAAEPGAFLDGDLHLTPKGHAALAQAIAEAMNRPPVSKSALELPPGRSWPPTADEFRSASECLVKGSTAAGCETKLVREWLRVVCRDREARPGAGEDDDELLAFDDLEAIELVRGGHGDALVGSSLLLPVVEGDDVEARFLWRKTEQVLHAKWPAGSAAPAMFFDPPKRRGPAPARAEPRQRSAPGKPFAPPQCPSGQAPAGAMVRCAPRCDATTPCVTGHCEPWPGGGFCAVP